MVSRSIDGAESNELTLHESAESLGVHYMTVYRYVRLGLLRADKVRGTWRVTRSDLEVFQASSASSGESASSANESDPDSTEGSSVKANSGRRRAPWAKRFESRLVAGDVQGSWGVIEAALASGAQLDDIYQDIVAPALQSIGERFSNGDLDISIERRAVGIVTRLIGRLGPRFTRRGRSRGEVVVGAVAGEFHTIALSMSADLLRRHGWDVSDLGADVPASGFVHMALSIEGLTAIGLSVVMSQHLVTAAEAIQEIRSAVPGLAIVIGGAAIIDREHAESLGADHFAKDARQLVLILDSMRTSKESAKQST